MNHLQFSSTSFFVNQLLTIFINAHLKLKIARVQTLVFTLDPLRSAPASSLPQADTWLLDCDFTTSHIGMSKGLDRSLIGGWRESIASNRKGPLYLYGYKT